MGSNLAELACERDAAGTGAAADMKAVNIKLRTTKTAKPDEMTFLFTCSSLFCIVVELGGTRRQAINLLVKFHHDVH